MRPRSRHKFNQNMRQMTHAIMQVRKSNVTPQISPSPQLQLLEDKTPKKNGPDGKLVLKVENLQTYDRFSP